MHSQSKITIRGKKWSCRRIGSGFPCLVIGISPLYTFIPNSALTSKLEFIEIPLYCGNEHPDFDVSQLIKDDLVTDIEEIRKQLGYDKIFTFAHSGNGFTALEYALKFPQHVLGNILISTMPCWSAEFTGARSNFFQNEYFQKHASPARKAALQKNLELFEQQKKQLSADDLYVAQSISMTPLLWADPNYDATSLWAKLDVNGKFFNNFFSKIYVDYDSRAHYQKLAVSTFLALGIQDFIFPPTDWDFIKTNLYFHIQLFSHSVHNPMAEEQKLFDQTVAVWIDNLK